MKEKKTSQASEKIYKIKELTTRLEVTLQEIDQIKKSLPELFVRMLRRAIHKWPQYKIDRFLKHWYWKDPCMGTVFVEARKLFPRVVKIFPKAFDHLCRSCGGTAKVTFNSWTEYKVKKTWINAICEECGRAEREAMEAENKEMYERYDQRRREEEEYRKTLRTMPYKEYLQTDHWKEVSTKARYRAGYRCQLCNAGNKSLQAHHRTYENRGRELPGDLIVLCRPCHERHHGIISGEEE